MTCHDVRDRLPLHLYGDLPGAEAAAVEQHLLQCPGCRRELAAFECVRRGLSATPVPPAVDTRPIVQADADRQRRSARRWRLTALAGLAAAVALAAGRLDVRVGDRQLVVRWGATAAPPAPPPAATVVVREPVAPPDLDERLERMSELIRALAANAEAGDRARAAELTALRQELATLRQQNHRRWSETAREVSALYTAQFGSRQTGVNP